MKPSLKSLFAAMFLFGSLATAAPEWHTFKSTDGSRTFDAELLNLSSSTQKITVRMKDSGKQVTFNLAQVSEEDQTYAKDRGRDLAALSGFRLQFSKKLDQTGRNDAGTTKVTTYNGSYTISIDNSSREDVQDITVDYILVWRKDSFEGLGENQIVKGSHTIDNAIAGYDERIDTSAITLQSVIKPGTSTAIGGCCKSKGGTLSTPTLRSRDQLVGCVVQIKVAGKVLKTDATSESLLKDYQDQFESAE